MRIHVPVHGVRPSRELRRDAREDLAGHRRVRVDEVVPAHDARTAEDARAAQRDEVRGVCARAESGEPLRRRAEGRDDDADGVPAPHELRRDVDRDLLAAADPRVEEVEEHLHARASGRRACSSRAGRNERTSGRRTSPSRHADPGAMRIASSADRRAARRSTRTWCDDESWRRNP